MSDDRARLQALGELLALVVHDLRNPAATISANVSFVAETESLQEPDAREALEDVGGALGELMRGLDQLSWVGRWLAGGTPVEGAPGDVRAAVKSALHGIVPPVVAELPAEPLEARAAGPALARIVEVFVRNALAHAAPASIRVVVVREGDDAVVEVRDGGRAVGRDLRDVAFTAEGQNEIKSRTDGRYSRSIGLLAAAVVAEGIGATLEAGGTDGAAVLRARVPLAR